MRAAISLALLLCASRLGAEEGRYKSWSPAGRSFACEIPRGWSTFDEEDAAHALGPDDASASYRAGIDVHWVDRSQAGFVEWKDAVERLRRADRATSRQATPVRLIRSAGVLARVFEVTELRRLPPDRLPSSELALHHYVAVVPSGSGYFVARLSSSRDAYLEHKEDWARFLKSFRP